MSYTGPAGPRGFSSEAERVEYIIAELDTREVRGWQLSEVERETRTAMRHYHQLLRFGLGVTTEQAMEALFTKGLNELVTKTMRDGGGQAQL